MNAEHPYQKYYETMKPALANKAEELRLLGMDAVNEEDIWSYLTLKKWKRPGEDIHIHQLVSDIMSVSSSQFMTYATVEAYKGPNVFGELSEEELRALLHG
ncbi:post-transcriptional regulator [Peribacillus sp. SCS-155]|uniref:post-transcriptional regulator n=1 Tax=Peribacillus sedimenti TaxID=3115297 RepID=UPI00390674C6